MFIIIGIVVVIVGVVGAFAFEGGNVAILIQPVEYVIIFGAALGALIISSGTRFMSIVKAVPKVMKPELNEKNYEEVLKLFYDLASSARREGLLSLENHIETPEESNIFSKYDIIMKDKETLNFICENLRIVVGINPDGQKLAEVIEIDIDVIEEEALYPGHMINKVSDSLPGLGIVAAVLGIVLVMGVISSPPAVLGHKVAVALVGTFTGILACYGFLGPMATNLEEKAKQKVELLNVIKICIISLNNGMSPTLVVEYARKGIPQSERPTTQHIEEAMKGGGHE